MLAASARSIELADTATKADDTSAALGASQVALGTDYPFDMGEEHPLDVLAAVEGLSDDDRRRIKAGNAPTPEDMLPVLEQVVRRFEPLRALRVG